MTLTYEEQFKQENEYVNKQIQSDNQTLSLIDAYFDRHSDFFLEKIENSDIYHTIAEDIRDEATDDLDDEICELEEKIEDLELRASELYGKNTSLKKQIKELEAALQRQP